MNVKAARLTTQGLAIMCGFLLLLVIVEYAGYGRGYGWTPDIAGEAGPAPVGAIDSKPVSLPPASAFAEIEMHPLFNEDRKPTPFDASDGGDGTPAPSPLNIALTGVLLDDAHNVRVAMLQDKTRNQAIALKVGMPLEGDQAAWTLVEVKPRAVVFRSAANETSEVELETSLVQPPHPPPGRTPARPPMPPPANASVTGNKQTEQAAGSDLARRIEDRRKQMREDAERLRNGGAGKPASPKK